ncbi:HAD-IIIC family phosphatase [Comamonadaceae bacterium G21597-S1]|nr:HAD-IIIC family phosphatase [Comamonadaceae bacterium G21597-S1]
MMKTKTGVDDLLHLERLDAIRSSLATTRLEMTLPEAQKLTRHMQALAPNMHVLKLGVIHTYTSELLNPWFALESALQGLEVTAYHAPYGATIQEAQIGSGLAAHKPDITLLLLQREDLHPDLARPLAQWSSVEQDELRVQVVARLETLISRLRALEVGEIVLSILPSPQERGMGLCDAQLACSESTWWARLKADIAQMLRDKVPSSLLLDLDEVLFDLGRDRFFDKRLWYSARFPFTARAAREVARKLAAIGAVLRLPKAKVIVLDADNTLWGGIVGEDGMDGIALGPDYPGNLFVAFQRRILDYQQRGFILALCSKNNAEDLDQVLREHPHQLLRDAHFAARRVNWLPKPENLKSLADELNLGLDSFIFVDDSDHECAAVRQQLSQVEVIQTPSRPIDVPTCLDHVARLEILSLTAEDSAKTDMYAQERMRRELKTRIEETGVGIDDYLASLEMKMQVSVDNAAHVARLSQMTLKTNQFNLTTRRYQEQQVREFIADKSWLVADFSLTDIFGNSGVVGLAIFNLNKAPEAELDTFLMSCRVIGRQAEAAFLQCLCRHLATQGFTQLVADFLPTAKNALASSFLQDQGFATRDDGRYVRSLVGSSLSSNPAIPIKVTLEI